MVWVGRFVLRLPLFQDMLCRQHVGDRLFQRRSCFESAFDSEVLVLEWWIYKASIRRQRLAIDTILIHLRVECLLVRSDGGGLLLFLL